MGKYIKTSKQELVFKKTKIALSLDLLSGKI